MLGNNVKRVGWLVGVLLVLVMIGSIISPAMAVEQKTPTRINLNEKEITKHLKDTNNEQNSKKSKDIVKELLRIAKRDIEKSIKNITYKGTNEAIALTEDDVVYLGKDKTFYTSDIGDNGSHRWGVAPMWYGSDYNLSDNKAEASVLIGPGGYGGATAWAWVGKTFYVSGSGTKPANIRMSGHIWGLTSAVAGGSSSVEINLVVWDATTETRYSTTIYSKSESAVGWTEVNSDFNNGISVNLQGGHYYIVYVEVITSGAVYGTGEAGSDFGRFDGDYFGEGVWYYSITIDF